MFVCPNQVQANEVRGPCTPTERQPHTPDGSPPLSPPTHCTRGPRTPCTYIDAAPNTLLTSTPSEKHVSCLVSMDTDASSISTDELEIPPTSNLSLSEPSTPKPQFKLSSQSGDQQTGPGGPSTPPSYHLPHTPSVSPPSELSQLAKSSRHRSQRTPPKKRHRKDSKSHSKSYILKEAFRHKVC